MAKEQVRKRRNSGVRNRKPSPPKPVEPTQEKIALLDEKDSDDGKNKETLLQFASKHLESGETEKTRHSRDHF